MCALVAAELGCDRDEVLVCSTGLIGIPLPMDADRGRHPRAGRRPRSADGGGDAGRGDPAPPTPCARRSSVDGGGFTVGGMAKGAAMLAPDMATMLAVLTTDAEAEPDRAAGGRCAPAWPTSFNALTVDGCTSTNDTVLLLASGAAGPVDADAARATR